MITRTVTDTILKNLSVFPAANIIGPRTEKCMVIDEIQRLPTLYSQLRSLIDENRSPARYIMLGSASPNIIKGVSESLAGRVFFTELMPFSLLEAEGIYTPGQSCAGLKPNPQICSRSSRRFLSKERRDQGDKFE